MGILRGICSAMARYRLILIASIAVLTASCEDLGFGDVCTLELGARFSPADTTIQVGQTFQASVQLLSCGGKQRLADVIAWHAEDPTVATVDGSTGRVVGRGRGTTRILASGQRYGNVGGLLVSVGAAGP